MQRTREMSERLSFANGSAAPELSVVVTLLDEAASLEELYERTVAALDRFGWSFELIFVDDGSTDETFVILERLHAADGRVRAVRFKRNFGQHPAMHAGLSRARGRIIVTMDGDLQSAPEQILELVRALDQGCEVASGKRTSRQEPWRRTLPSRLINIMLRRFTGVALSDFGCAFNAYRSEAIMPVLGAIGKQRFTKALVLSTGASVVEVDVTHTAGGRASRHARIRLIRLALHVLVGFWPRPIQVIGLALGIVCTLGATAVGIYGVVFWIVTGDFPGPLFAGGVVIAILGVQGFILALIGEYLARMQRDLEDRPLYTIDQELG